jgi:CubicO group peptidase (beta-lactamase class C family)
MHPFCIIHKKEIRGKAQKLLTFFVFLIIISMSTSSTAALASLGNNFSSGGSIAPADLEEFIDQAMSREMDNYHLPGAAVAVVQNEQILLVKGYGMADMDKGTSVDA